MKYSPPPEIYTEICSCSKPSCEDYTKSSNFKLPILVIQDDGVTDQQSSQDRPVTDNLLIRTGLLLMRT